LVKVKLEPFTKFNTNPGPAKTLDEVICAPATGPTLIVEEEPAGIIPDRATVSLTIEHAPEHPS